MPVNPKSNTYPEGSMYMRQAKQESVMNYPVRAAIKRDYYPTKEGNDTSSEAPEERRERCSSQQTT